MASRSPMHNFTTLIKRLEAATSRLEDIAQLAIDLNPTDDETLSKTLLTPLASSSTPAPSTSSAAAPPAPTAAAPAPKAVAPPPPPPPQEDLPEVIEEFDNFLNQSVKPWVKLSHELDKTVGEQADYVLKGYQSTRRLLLIATKAQKPRLDGPDFQGLMKPAIDALTDLERIKDANRGNPFYDHLSAIANSIMVLAWPSITNKPYKHAEEMLSSAQFYGNRVIKNYKDTDPKQVEWTRSLYQIFRDLAEYIKTYYSNGIPWNPDGDSVVSVARALDAAPTTAAATAAPAHPAAGAPPPPPPPGPPPILKINEVKAESSAPGGIGAVFSELNQGEGVTKGLRKVDKSEMTHKNPSLRASSVVPDSGSSARGKSPSPPGTKPKPESMRVKKPPKKELDGNKWTVENFDSPPNPVEIDVTMNHSILISKCSNTTIIVKGKGNAITVENTTRLALVVDSLVSTVDVVKSKNFALQVMGTIPTILLDQLDGAQIYLSKESIATKVYTSKSDSVNVNVIADGDEDYKEVPLPAQLCSYWDKEKQEMVSEIVTHSG
ncbi:adenylate cyclase associated N terminal-domain-containing protein [Cladorrhinum sp. PSN259]|nr:adenylate cyclase associated N terminal-domain-containing protein [Cladorrhinum sp. PSN259]